MPAISQHTYDIIEIAALGFGCLASFVTLIYVIKYTRRTYSIADSTEEAAREAAETASVTGEFDNFVKPMREVTLHRG